MGIREKISENKSLGISLAVCLVVFAALILYYDLRTPPLSNANVAWYTDDDGENWFKDSAYLVPPFDHNGKEAVRAMVYSYANGSKQYVAYMTKFTDDGKKELTAAIADAEKDGKADKDAAPYQEVGWVETHTLVKHKGDKNWVSDQTIEGARARSPSPTPDGSPVTDSVMAGG